MDRTISKEISYVCRGLAAYSVIISHYAQWYMENGRYGIIAQLMSTIGRYGVAVFLFLSGYGLVISTYKKNKLDRNFILRRFITVYIPYLIIKTITEIALKGEIKKIIILFFALDNWYIATIIVFYSMFYILYRYLYKYRIKFLFLGIIGYSLLTFSLGLNESWFLSNICFLMGVLYSEFVCDREEDKFHIKLRKILLYVHLNKKILFVFSVLFVILYPIYLYLSLQGIGIYMIIKIVISIVFINLVLQIIGQIKIKEFMLIKYSGVISLELYLLHRASLRLGSAMFVLDNRICSMIIGGILTFLFSHIFNKLYKKGIKVLKEILEICPCKGYVTKK